MEYTVEDFRPLSLQAKTDPELIEDAQSGSKAAFGVLFERHKDRVFSVALGILGNPSDARDVSQETFYRAFRRLSKLRKDGGVQAYLVKTASNAAIDLLRTRRSGKNFSMEGLAESGQELQSRVPGPEIDVTRSINNEMLMTALRTLPDDQRVVVVMHHLEGASIEEIAKRVKIPEGTVKSRLGRARESLRRKLIGKLS